MRTVNVQLRAAKNSLTPPGAFLYLLDIEISDDSTAYYVLNNEPILWNGKTYNPINAEIGAVSQDTRGGLDEIEVNVSNVTRAMSAYVELNDMRGKLIKVTTVSSAHLDDATMVLEEISCEINAIAVREDVVTFVLGHERLMQQRFPGERFLRNNCRWAYKSPECGYAGALTTCSKILEGSNGCRVHDNVARFGGFPGLPSVTGRFMG